MEPKRITILAGHYGSGKTNVAVNYAVWQKNQGYNVFKACNGIEGIKVIEKENIHSTDSNHHSDFFGRTCYCNCLTDEA